MFCRLTEHGYSVADDQYLGESWYRRAVNKKKSSTQETLEVVGDDEGSANVDEIPTSTTTTTTTPSTTTNTTTSTVATSTVQHPPQLASKYVVL